MTNDKTVTMSRELAEAILSELTSGAVSVGTGAKLRALLAARPVAVVPEGWKLVPIVPTIGMLEALMEWREVGNVNAYNNILESAPACLDNVKELNNGQV